MTDLEGRLLALGRELDYPPEPDIAAAVRDRLPAEPPGISSDSPIDSARRGQGATRLESRGARQPRAARPRALRILAIACVVLLALAAAALAVSPAARDALRDLFDIGGVTIETTTAPAPEPAPRALDLGDPTPLGAARDRLGFRPLAPTALGHPDAAFADPVVPALALTYGPGPRLPPTTTTDVGLLVTELPGRIAGEYLHKVVVQASTVDRLRIHGRRAAWIAGAPHFFFYGRGNAYVEHPLDVAQNVLLLDRGGLLVRLEGALDRAEAVRIARSLRPR
jgi:hypothetical protein